MTAPHPTATARSAGGWRGDVAAAFPGWLAARVIVGVSWLTSDAWTGRSDANRPFHLDLGLFAWDGDWYRKIATGWYGGTDPESVRFFPGFPALGRAFDAAGAGADIGLVLGSALAALAVGAVVHRLTLVESGDPARARLAAWLVALLPASFVLVWAYSEGLMMTTAAAALLAARRGRYGWAAVAALLCGLTRPVGVLVAIPVAIEALRTWSDADPAGRVRRAMATAAAPASAASYLAWVQLRFDDGLRPLREHERFRGDLSDPVTRLARAAWRGVVDGSLTELGHVLFALGAVVLIVVAFRVLPASYGVYAAAFVVVALSADGINSLERYMTSAFPLAMALAMVTPARLRVPLVASSGVVMGIAAGLAWTERLVP